MHLEKKNIPPSPNSKTSVSSYELQEGSSLGDTDTNLFFSLHLLTWRELPPHTQPLHHRRKRWMAAVSFCPHRRPVLGLPLSLPGGGAQRASLPDAQTTSNAKERRLADDWASRPLWGRRRPQVFQSWPVLHDRRRRSTSGSAAPPSGSALFSLRRCGNLTPRLPTRPLRMKRIPLYQIIIIIIIIMHVVKFLFGHFKCN